MGREAINKRVLQKGRRAKGTKMRNKWYLQLLERLFLPKAKRTLDRQVWTKRPFYPIAHLKIHKTILCIVLLSHKYWIFLSKIVIHFICDTLSNCLFILANTPIEPSRHRLSAEGPFCMLKEKMAYRSHYEAESSRHG